MSLGPDDVMQPLAYGERFAGDLDGTVLELVDASHLIVEDRPAADQEVLAAC